MILYNISLINLPSVFLTQRRRYTKLINRGLFVCFFLLPRRGGGGTTRLQQKTHSPGKAFIAKQRHLLLDITAAALRASKIKRRGKRQGGGSRTAKGFANLLPASPPRTSGSGLYTGLSQAPWSFSRETRRREEGSHGVTSSSLACPAASAGHGRGERAGGRDPIPAVSATQP